MYLFMLVFIKSGTWESYKVYKIREKRKGTEFTFVKHRLNWGNFLQYLRNTPKRVMEHDIFKRLSLDR